MNAGALKEARRRDARIAQLEGLSELTLADRAELQRLHDNRDHMWQRLMPRIASHRAALRRLETYADEIGLRGVTRSK